MVDENKKPHLPSAFDAHHAPEREIIEKCVHCGFCLPVCPTYALWGQEMDSPRGRIYLMKMALQGTAQMNEKWVSHFDACLGCLACMPACPSGVDYGKLIEATRAQIARNYRRPSAANLHRRLLFETFTKPKRLKFLRWPLLAYQKTGLQALLRAIGLFGLLPKSFGTMDALLPKVLPNEAVAPITPAQGEKRRRVGLLLGCVQQAFFSHVNAATARVLSAEGCEVIAPAEQPCCGALFLHAGEENRAQELARRTIDVFERANVETVVINAAGCGSNIKQYGHLLRDDPAYAQRAADFASKSKDISEILSQLPPRAERKPLRVRVAFHDSCHLQHAQGISGQPRSLLAQIPGTELLEIPESPICCGSAGIYNLVQPDPAKELGDRKAQWIVPLQADVVATGNPGCLLQLQSSLARANHSIPVLHTIQLLDASIRGLPRDLLLSSDTLSEKSKPSFPAREQ
jgi:glycolate oxidase iron-sulfur subunit